MNRDEMRSRLLAPVKRKRKTVTVNGADFELLQPLVKEREEFTKFSDNGAELVSRAIIAMAVMPGTEERIFEETDIEAFKNQCVGGLIDQVAEEIVEFVRVSETEKKD
jgi:hypothetical protein